VGKIACCGDCDFPITVGDFAHAVTPVGWTAWATRGTLSYEIEGQEIGALPTLR
jgi:hypothetical protein